MAITFGKNNQRIRALTNSKFIHPDLNGNTNYDDFKMATAQRVYNNYYVWINNGYLLGNYVMERYTTRYTTLLVMKGERPEITNAGFSIQGMNTLDGIMSNPDVLLYYRWEQNADWSTLVSDEGDYLELLPEFFLPRQTGSRNGTPTYFIMYTHEETLEQYVSYLYRYTMYRNWRKVSDRLDGVLTGTVGPLGSGSDLEFTFKTTDVETTSFHKIPYGMRLYRPNNKIIPLVYTLTSNTSVANEGETISFTLTLENMDDYTLKQMP